ncbi:MAG TPA: methyltransferase domain-containing protein [Devosiaceae bacterium]|nr:methyltransferase domain-containing protein [Devosiaceae bacterium]
MRDTGQQPFSVRFDENNQEFAIAGLLRPQYERELGELIESFQKVLAAVRGTLYVNVKRLVRVNNVGFRVLSGLLVGSLEQRPDLRIEVVTSSVVGWSTRKFKALSRLNSRLAVAEYDNDFYPGQAFLEEGGFIPILRTQTQMTWQHERHVLPRHGLRPGMAVADICCGIGDFAVLAFKQFAPSRLVALDHSRSSLDYARRVAGEFGVHGIEYVYGDAAEMLLEDNQFDFVTCRHALQIFNQPELILAELVRVCKPGGRVYVTNEKISHCVGEPHGESIQWTYNELSRLFADFDMDLEFGPKSRRHLDRAGLADIKAECFMVTNLDGDPQGFASMIASWESLFANGMSERRGDDAAFREKFSQGFQDHIHAALHPTGYAGWPIWVASGKKPG